MVYLKKKHQKELTSLDNMTKIIFVCHGNICRSVAAEYICKDILLKQGRLDKFEISSRATSLEEIGNDIYPPMKYALNKYGISFDKHHAKQITRKEVEDADLIFYMDYNNQRNLERMFGYNPKFHLITEHTDFIEVIGDPWYTDLFDEVVEELKKCIEDILYTLR